jgi:hypothetical protein
MTPALWGVLIPAAAAVLLAAAAYIRAAAVHSHVRGMEARWRGNATTIAQNVPTSPDERKE